MAAKMLDEFNAKIRLFLPELDVAVAAGGDDKVRPGRLEWQDRDSMTRAHLVVMTCVTVSRWL